MNCIFIACTAKVNACSEYKCLEKLVEFFQIVCENYGANSMEVNVARKQAFDAFSEKVKEKSAGVRDARGLIFYSEKNGRSFLNTGIWLLIPPIYP